MKKKILVMGLPGSGKTTLSKKLTSLLDAVWLNADIEEKRPTTGILALRED